MLKKYSIEFGILFSIVLAALLGGQAAAQSTIFNIPSTDVVAKGKKYFEFDFVGHLEDQPNGGTYTYNPRVIFGVGKGLEAGVNVASFDSSSATTVYVQPNLKWQVYSNENSGIATTVGAIAFAPVKDTNLVNPTGQTINDTYGLFYWNMSKKFKGNYGPRITLGLYRFGGYEPLNRQDKGGGIVGYEQPITKRVSFVADWFTGKNAIGYFTPGFSISLPKSSLFNIGYSIGNYNYAPANTGLFVYYGITF